MPQTYFSLITNQGLIKEAASNEPGGTAIDLTEMAVGDSNGAYYDPDGSEVSLANEVHRVTLTHVVVDENNTNQLIVEAVLDETIGPFYIREVGIFDSNGDLFAIGKYPETFKPNLPAGSGKRLYIRMILGFANSPNVNLVINNDIALDPNFGTDVNNALAERLVKTNNLSDLDNVSTARVNLGVAEESVVNSMINDRLLKTNNLSDLENITTARSNLGLGSAALANNATESDQGIAKIATNIESNEGTNNSNIITPLRLKEKIDNGFINSKSVNGYSYWPNGVIFQWGQYSFTGSHGSYYNIYYPIVFPITCRQIVSYITNTANSTHAIVHCPMTAMYNNYFQVQYGSQNGAAYGVTLRYIAIGE